MKPIKTNRKVHHHVMKTCTLHTHTHILCKWNIYYQQECKNKIFLWLLE
jgi:hypothetical protein